MHYTKNMYVCMYVCGAETEKACEEKLLMMLDGLAERFVLEQSKDLNGGYCGRTVRRDRS